MIWKRSWSYCVHSMGGGSRYHTWMGDPCYLLQFISLTLPFLLDNRSLAAVQGEFYFLPIDGLCVPRGFRLIMETSL